MARTDKKSVATRIFGGLLCACLGGFMIWLVMPEPLLWTGVGGGVGFVIGCLWGEDGLNMIALLF